MTVRETIMKMTDNENFIVFDSNDKIRIDIDDFAGFDDDWDEIFNDIDEDIVDSVLDYLKENADSVEEDYYTTYYFNNFSVIVGYTSYDI